MDASSSTSVALPISKEVDGGASLKKHPNETQPLLGRDASNEVRGHPTFNTFAFLHRFPR
jgi:hypothetical protein